MNESTKALLAQLAAEAENTRATLERIEQVRRGADAEALATMDLLSQMADEGMERVQRLTIELSDIFFPADANGAEKGTQEA